MSESPISAVEFEERLAALCRGPGRAVFPRRHRDRHILFRSAVQTLDAGAGYSEPQLNIALRQWLSQVGPGLGIDHVTLRRYLVDEGYLARDASGSLYQAHPAAKGQATFAPEVSGVDSAGVVRLARERAAERKRRQVGAMETAADGAHSVFRFIERTAERVDDGIRWQTIDYENKPHYHYEVFNGCGGISLFLAEYHRLTGNPAALDLAIGANQWCSAPAREGPSRGLLTGRTGVAMSWLHLSRIAGRPEYLDYCTANAEILLAEGPGPMTDLMGGAASNGLFLLRLWEATGERRYLEGAVRNGAWLAEQLVRDELGCHCLARVDGGFGKAPYAGVAHGIAGVAHYLVLLYAATQDPAWAMLAREILETLVRHALPDRGGLNWSPLLGQTELSRCQWSHGAAGIGLVFARASAVLGEPAYWEVALKCGATTHAYGDFRRNATQCIGLTGCGELFVELFRISRDEQWLERAREFASLAYGYRDELPEGDAWPIDKPGLYSADYMYGAAGIGHYFLRVWKPDEIAMPLM